MTRVRALTELPHPQGSIDAIKLNLYRSCYIRLKVEGMVGGDAAKFNQFPYQVSVHEDGEHLCGGGIIGDELILTAAHCVIDTDTGTFRRSRFSIIAAVTDLNSLGDNAIRIEVEKIYVPRSYLPVNSNPNHPYRPIGDIAVLRVCINILPCSYSVNAM